HSLSDIKNFVKSIEEDSNSILFAICDNKTDNHIGNIKIGPINRIHRKADISFFIGNKDYWSKGYAKESIELILEYAFNILNLHKLCAGVYEDNIGSKKTLENNGFIVEGIKKDECYIDSKWTNVYILGKINDN
ncbi:GNAT family N-acetyltransferase, partial [Sulfurimonas sp. SAG-AH-194-I05]